MKIIDISWPISENTTEYKDRKTIIFERTKVFDVDGVRESNIAMNSHTGTHIDAPAHFTQDGAYIDHVKLASCIGTCHVLDFTDVDNCITKSDLKKHEITQGDIILFKTKNSFLIDSQAFDKNFIYLEHSGAQYLADKKVKSVGIDYLGLERDQPDHASHKRLMEKNIAIIEGLRLGHVTPGQYFLCCLPIYVTHLEASLARAILIDKF